MVKLKLTTFKHEENRLVFIIEKSKFIKNFLSEFLKECGFKENLFIQYYDVEKTDVRRFEDVENNYVNNNFDIEIIHTHKSIILIVRIKSNLILRLRKMKLEKRVINSVMKYCDFKTTKKNKK